MTTREHFIVDVWKRLGKEVVGASELDAIQQALAERFGADTSPATIARTLADHGVRLEHPELLEADVRWRERRELLTPEDLTFDTLDAATALMEKIEHLTERLERADDLRQSVRQLKNELELLAASETVPESNRQLAREVARWFTVWLQNPQLFADWLDLRRHSAEFRDHFRQ